MRQYLSEMNTNKIVYEVLSVENLYLLINFVIVGANYRQLLKNA